MTEMSAAALRGRRTVRRHRSIESYLVQVLGFTWNVVHQEAERLEHTASEDLVDRMAFALGDPLLGPHGADPGKGRVLRRVNGAGALWIAVAISSCGVPAAKAAAQTSQSAAIERFRGIAIDERVASDAHIHLGDTVRIAASPEQSGDTVIVAAIAQAAADPSEVARREYRVRLHLDQLQLLTNYGDRVDRFAVATRGRDAARRVERSVNNAAFGFHAYPSREIAVETSRTFQVVNRFHRAIGVITIVASTIFLLCIMLLKIEERRRDVAALRLMGMSASSIVQSVVLEATLVACLGSVMGVAIGWLAARLVNFHYQAMYRTPLYFAVVTWQTVVFAVTLSVLLGVAAGLLASVRLVRSPPLELFGR